MATKCSVCHEKFKDPIGTYSMDRHALYSQIHALNVDPLGFQGNFGQAR